MHLLCSPVRTFLAFFNLGLDPPRNPARGRPTGNSPLAELPAPPCVSHESVAAVPSLPALPMLTLEVFVPRTNLQKELLPIEVQSIAEGSLLHLVLGVGVGQDGEELYEQLIRGYDKVL